MSAVEFIEGENYQAAEDTIVLEKSATRYLEMSGASNSSSFRCYEDASKAYSKKAVVFLPYSEYCTDHKDLFLHEDEKLVKPGDKFKSHDDFVQYLNEHAKRWCFYYRCTDSRRPNTDQESYTYNCVYLRNKEKYKKKGLRKRISMKTDCPCKIKLRHLPDEKELTVVYVCNHHDHKLSLDNFYKLQHGRRLPPYVKEEIKDFLQLKVDIMKIRAYVEMETGFTMSRPFFYTLEKNMKSRNIKRHISEQRLNMLKQKIAAVDEMYGYNEEYVEEEDNGDDELESENKIKQQLLLKKTERAMRTPSLKRRSRTNEEDSKRMKIEENSDGNETVESVKHLQETAGEVEENTWIADQCVPDRTETEETMHIEAIENLPEDALLLVQSDSENYSYTIEYFPDESNNEEVVTNEFGEIIEGSQVTEVQENDIDNIAYETVVSDAVEETQSEVPEYLEDEQIMEEGTEMQVEDQEHVAENESQVHDGGELENQVQYIAEVVENNENVQYVAAEANDDGAQNVTVQAAESSGTTHSLLPVFDVYMKDGNVTGFLVNDGLIAGLKDGVHKEIQTSAELLANKSQETGKADAEGQVILDFTHSKSGDIYTKHEYVHKYNIDKYMVQPHFPKYIETLAKETYMDVLQMFTNIYNEKAMFKITTTQKGKEGNTRIWYIKDTHRTKKQRHDETHKEKLGQNLQSIFLLKEKLRYLKKKNSELIIKNKQLEEVALRLVQDDVGYASVRD
uniref:FAR1 domain-containing protein n=1 Tax=Heliothis virescens TaxID=7102 RepID=A0A2A4JQZ6_HELVI